MELNNTKLVSFGVLHSCWTDSPGHRHINTFWTSISPYKIINYAFGLFFSRLPESKHRVLCTARIVSGSCFLEQQLQLQ